LTLFEQINDDNGDDESSNLCNPAQPAYYMLEAQQQSLLI